jgi:AcrR family transcriptional regulator
MNAKHVREPEDTRRKILQAAFEEFHKNGFQGGSLNRIVDAAGTTKGALFHHFSGKNDLGYSVIDEVVRPHMRTRWLELLTNSIDPVTDLKRAMKTFAHTDVEKGGIVHGCPLNNLAQEMSPLDEEFRKRIENIYIEWRECLEAAFTRGIKSGKIRKDINPRNVAALVVAALEGMIGAAKNAQSAEPLKQAGAAFFDYLDSLKP